MLGVQREASVGSDLGQSPATAVGLKGFPRSSAAAAALVLALAAPSTAGPPFLTDDPEPVELQHWEAYLFTTYDAAREATGIQGPAAEVNYGAAPGLQLHLVVPYTTAEPAGGGSAQGLGDFEVGVKYRFVEEGEHRPQIGIFPMVELPTGNERRGLGNGRLWARLPLWLQKSWGPWTTYGGGGYAMNGADGARDYVFGGWLVQRDLGKRLTLGAEVYLRGADSVGGRGTSILNGGGVIALAHGLSVLLSAGHSVTGERHGIAYVGLYWTGGGTAGPDAPGRVGATCVGPDKRVASLAGGGM